MKPLLTLLIIVGFLSNSALASTLLDVQGRRVQDLNIISTRVLQRSISRKFYKTLRVSPIDGWIIVRANWTGTKLGGARILRSDLNGVYDKLALKFADDLEITGSTGKLTQMSRGSILLHLLVYHTADGTMLLSFPNFEDAGGDQMYYWGCARLAVIKKDGRWVEIEGPDGLHGRGWAVRPADATQCPFQVHEGPTPPREGKLKATLPAPPASVLQPIIASSRRNGFHVRLGETTEVH
jgi:type II secretory pathway pseudopilin PulG